MRIYIAVFVLCAVACAEAFRVARDTEGEVSSTEGSTTAAPQECCYPRPPKSRKFRRCCEIPMEQIYEKFDQDLQECKEQNQKKEEEEPATSTTTTPAPPKEEETPDLENFVDSNEDMDEPAAPAPDAGKAGRSENHHKGRCHKRHHRGKGKCVKATMEKHGWSNNGTLNWDVIEKAGDEATSEQGKNWAQIMKKAIQVCKQEPYLQLAEAETQEDGEKEKEESSESDEKPDGKKKGKHHGGKHGDGHRGKKFTIEKAAFRCMKNNAVMNCPNFPEDDAYCMELRDVYNRCGARKQPGKKPIRWCENEGRKVFKSHKNKA